MKQLYLLGALVAVVLVLMFGLSKLMNAGATTSTTPQPDTQSAAATDAANPSTPQTPAATGTAAETSASTTLPEQPQATAMDTTATAGATAPAPTQDVVMKTNKGDITIELYTDKMPVTTANFLKLVNEKFYDGTKFHRVIDHFMIQGGDPLTKDDTAAARWGTGGPGYTIKDEFAPGLSNVRGTIAMANAGPNTGGSQFFINTVDNTYLDGKHPVFGRVIAGMDVVDAISKTPTDSGDRPVDPVVVESISAVKS